MFWIPDEHEGNQRNECAPPVVAVGSVAHESRVYPGTDAIAGAIWWQMADPSMQQQELDDRRVRRRLGATLISISRNATRAVRQAIRAKGACGASLSLPC